jgi:hypothetical protein
MRARTRVIENAGKINMKKKEKGEQGKVLMCILAKRELGWVGCSASRGFVMGFVNSIAIYD